MVSSTSDCLTTHLKLGVMLWGIGREELLILEWRVNGHTSVKSGCSLIPMGGGFVFEGWQCTSASNKSRQKHSSRVKNNKVMVTIEFSRNKYH